MWKLKYEILPKSSDTPTAMKDKEGKLLTQKSDINKHFLEYYKNVLRNRDIKPGLENHQSAREDLRYKTLKQGKLHLGQSSRFVRL